jgi:hypothetical protein
MNGNGKNGSGNPRLWGPITPISRDEIPSSRPAPYHALWVDIVQRIKLAPDDFAFRITCDDLLTAGHVADSLREYAARNYPKGTFLIRKVGTDVFVARGENYPTPEPAAAPVIDEDIVPVPDPTPEPDPEPVRRRGRPRKSQQEI